MGASPLPFNSGTPSSPSTTLVRALSLSSEMTARGRWTDEGQSEREGSEQNGHGG